MKIRETLLRLNRIQQTTPFKIIASVVVVALAIAAFATYYVAVTAPAARETAAMREEIRAAEESAGQPQNAEDREMRSALDASQKVFEDIAARRASPVNVGIGAAAIAGMMIAAIWLGLGLTYLALALLTAVVIFPLWRIGGTTWAQQREWSKQMSLGQAMRAVALLGTGLVILTASFVALMQAGRSFLAGPNQVFAIARNVLIEAVRIKVFLVLIIVLVFALAALPLVLDPTTPLRYRVQSFLQYGTGGAFWIIAFLTLFFSASTVAFEQRDRQIWQTMTKPVAAWQYLLGKWLGVVTLNAVLLAVCCAGVFLFTEYLRKQPAEGEQVQVVAGLSQGISRDRMLLETQVLAARERVTPADPMEFDSPDFQRGVAAYIEDQRSRDPDFARDDTTFRQVASDLHKSYVQNFRSIRAGAWAAYEFTGLQEAKRRNVPLTLRYKVDSGSNDPSHIYKLTFSFAGQILPPQDVGLGQAHTLTLYPNVIDDAGVLTLEVVNGALVPDENGALAVAPNPDMIVFPKDGLELFYAAGSYQGNFLRVAGVLWVKLAFLSMLAIAASTFLSFPVACLIAFSVFLGAEGAGYLKNSLEYYSAADEKGNINPIKVVIRAVGLAVSWMFASYHDLKPTMRLVDGRLLTWSAMSYGSFVLLAWTAALFGLAVGIFRKRELATYSGH